jgi:hypothetical protein
MEEMRGLLARYPQEWRRVFLTFAKDMLNMINFPETRADYMGSKEPDLGAMEVVIDQMLKEGKL